jgi:hypothetical protein
MRFRHPGWVCGTAHAGALAEATLSGVEGPVYGSRMGLRDAPQRHARPPCPPRAEPRGAQSKGARRGGTGAQSKGTTASRNLGGESLRRQAQLFAPSFQLSTLSTFDCGLLASQRSLRLRGEIFPMALNMKKSPASPLQCAVTQKHVCNSFGIRTYKSLDLKSPGMNSYKKYRGEGPLRSLQRQDLSTISHSEARISYKSLDLKAPGMNSYKKCRAEGWNFPVSTSA